MAEAIYLKRTDSYPGVLDCEAELPQNTERKYL